MMMMVLVGGGKQSALYSRSHHPDEYDTKASKRKGRKKTMDSNDEMLVLTTKRGTIR